MKILLTSPEQRSLTGQPMYVKNLTKGLRELGHIVICAEQPFGDFDLAIINDYYPECLGQFTAKKIYNFCHSKNPCDKPIIDKRIDGYLAPREEVAEQWGNEIQIIPIPIDISRWHIPTIKHPNYRIIAPATIDYLRLPMFKDLCSRANKFTEVWIVGKDCGAYFPLNKYVKVFPETPDIELLMRQCDEVAGIYVGTITLEAWAMGLKTSVYDEFGNWKYVDKPNDFNKYDYLTVAKQFLNLI